MPNKGNKCCCGGSSSPSHSPSSSPSSSPSPGPPITIEDCDDTAQYQFTVSGLVNGTLNCSGFNRTWTLSKATVPIVNNPEWNEEVGGKHAVIYFDDPYHVLGLGPHGIYDFTVAYTLEGDWECGVGGTNVFTQAWVFDGCTGWPATITVTRIV